MMLISYLFVVAISAHKNFNYEIEFKAFLKKFDKVYDGDEVTYRFNIFKANADDICQFNRGNHSYSKGINQFTDLTQPEFEKMVLGYLPRGKQINAVAGDHYEDVDWRTKGVLTPVKDQGKCGSDWAFSATGSVEAARFIKSSTLTSLSEQSLVDCAGSYGNQGCNGGLMDKAFDFIKAKGMPTEATYPYVAVRERCKKFAVDIQISSYTDSKDLEKDIVQQPVTAAVDGSRWASYKEGIFKCTGTPSLANGVLLVGSYSDYWVVKNSWGASWGEQGFMRLSKKEGEDCGITHEPSWPTI